MDGKLLRQLYHRLFSDRNLLNTRDCSFPDAVVLFIYFHAVMNNRSPRWARDKQNWPLFRPFSFPDRIAIGIEIALARLLLVISQAATKGIQHVILRLKH